MPTASWSQLPRKIQLGQAPEGTTLHSQRGRTGQVSFSSGRPSPTSWRSLSSINMGHCPARVTERRTLSPPRGRQMQQWVGQVPYDARTYLSRTKAHTLSQKQGKTCPTQGDKPAETEQALYLPVRKCPRSRPTLRQPSGWTNCWLQMPFLAQGKVEQT